MSQAIKETVSLHLMVPTLFADLNGKHGHPQDHKTTTIEVQRMKHKHFRKLQSLPEHEQLHYLMMELTGLSSDDIDELDAEDSASLSELIFGFMKKYAEVTKKAVGV